MKIPMFPCKYHQKGGFSMAMLVLGRVQNTFPNLLAFFFLILKKLQSKLRSKLEKP